MIEIVVKRDGREVGFDLNKIRTALMKAFSEVDKVDFNNISNSDSNKIIEKIVHEIANISVKKMSVEEIQDIVEAKLMCSHRKDVAKAYILYRNERTKIRNNNSDFMKVISEKLMASNVQNQNANIDEYSFGGRKGEADAELMRRYALDNCMSEMSKRNHLNNEIYIHDLDSYAVGMHNCLSVPFDKLLRDGFNTRQTDVRPAQSVSTAFQLMAVIFQLQSLQQFGGVSATHLDWTMVPYVRKSFYKHYKDGIKYMENHVLSNDEFAEPLPIDDPKYQKCSKAYDYSFEMTKREIYQAVEAMYHNLK